MPTLLCDRCKVLLAGPTAKPPFCGICFLLVVDAYHIEVVSRRERNAVRSLARTAVRSGRLVKPDRCDGCGEITAAPELHAHHPDYSKPLVVEWLCRACRGFCHRQVA
jgi:hypothetical protein